MTGRWSVRNVPERIPRRKEDPEEEPLLRGSELPRKAVVSHFLSLLSLFLLFSRRVRS